MNPSDCPSGQVLDDFFADRLPADVASGVESHLSDCPHCLEELRRRDSALSMAALAENPGDPPLFPSANAAAESLIRQLKLASRRGPTLPPSTSDPADTPTLDSADVVFEVIGQVKPKIATLRYQPLRSHAKGGLGEVFVALDVELQREVALKEIQSRFAGSEECRARFVSEAEITGGLEHPGIVPVYGLGAYPDGRPYYAMRFIRGDNFQAAAERFHAGGRPDYFSLEMRQLLARFVDVCNAVAYAHSRGVIHRDLKPGNIMLGDFGETLVVDWGLAKVGPAPGGESGGLPIAPSAAVVETVDGSIVGTPAYMSPEQATGRAEALSPASDIYSLGATLYFLLAMRPPHEAPDLPKLLSKVRSGKIEWAADVPAVPLALRAICEKAMALRPAERYVSALQLAEDVESWLADEPVGAYREPTLATIGRWMRKHSGIVAATAASVLVAVIGLGIGSLLLNQKNQELSLANSSLESANTKLDKSNRDLTDSYRQLDLSQKETEKKRQEAESERQIAQAVQLFLQDDLLRQGDPAMRAEKGEIAGAPKFEFVVNPTVKELLDRAALELAPDKINTRFPRQPAVQIEILTTVGDTYHSVGEHKKANEILQRVVGMSEAEFGPDHRYTLASSSRFAKSQMSMGRIQDAISLFENLIPRLKRTYGPTHLTVLAAVESLSLAYLEAGRGDLAVQQLEFVLKSKEQQLGPDDRHLMITLINLGVAYSGQGQTDAAIRQLEEAQKRILKTLGTNSPEMMHALMNLGIVYRHKDRFDDAIRVMKESHALCEALYGADHPATLGKVLYLVRLYCDSHQSESAIPLGLFLLDRLKAKYGPHDRNTLDAGHHLGNALFGAKKYRLAIRVYEQVQRDALKTYKLDDSFVVNNLNALARAELEVNEWAAGAEHLQIVYDALHSQNGPDTPETLRVLRNLAIAWDMAGEFQRAIPYFEELYTRRKETIGPAHQDTLETLRYLAATYLRSGNRKKGLELFEQALAIETANYGREHASTLSGVIVTARIYLEQEIPEKALPLFEEFVAVQRRLMTTRDPIFSGTLAAVSVELLKGKQYAAAEKYLREAVLLREQQAVKDNRIWTHWFKTLLGEALLGQGKFAEAEPLLDEGWKGMFANELPITDREVKQTYPDGLYRLADLYQSLGKPEEAAKWRKEADLRKRKSQPETPNSVEISPDPIRSK